MRRQHRASSLPTRLQCGFVLASTLILLSIVGCASSASQSGAAQPSPTITPPAITNTAPAHHIYSVQGIAAIKPHLSSVPSYTGDDLRQFVTTHPIVGPVKAGASVSIIVAQFLTCAEIDQQAGGGVTEVLSGCGHGISYGFVLESGGFTLDGASGGDDLTGDHVFLVFDPSSGSLLVYGTAIAPTTSGNGTPTPTTTTPTMTPATPAPGTATATTTPHISLALKPTSDVQTCQSSTTLTPITLTLNATGSNVPVAWTASTTETIGTSSTVWATIAPASGTLAVGGSTQFTVTPASAICTLSQNVSPDATYHITITYGSGQHLTFSDLVHSPIPD